jgi:4'-phosphopantetheinyl transferase
MNLFPVEIKNKINRFKRWQDAQASLLGKVLLKKGLENLYLKSSLSDLKYTKYGRPYLENAVDFNISHSGPYIVCAFSTKGIIGADIEQINPIRIEDFKNIFHIDEWHSISTSSNPYYTFYYYWTAKEAIIKADGRGLNVPLQNLLIKKGIGSIDRVIWYYQTISLFDNTILQIASNKKIEEVTLVELNIKDPHQNFDSISRV